jgi:hypothetical protein
MIAGEVPRIGAARHPQAGTDSTLARRKNGTHDQNEHVFPTGGCKAYTQVL